ncbi:MAG: cation:proton antiporter subunit C [Chloroflexota bacterium]
MENIVINLNYLVSMALFSLGFYTLIMQRNIIRKIIGLNIMETSVFFFLVSIGYLKQGIAPIAVEGAETIMMVNPIPQALILTGIVVAVSTSALALALTIRLYRHYGTLNVDEFEETGD